jgi:hypothetical protein
MGRADARSAQIGRSAGVVRSFQISAYSIKPFKGNFAANLLASDDWRAADVNEAEEVGPEVTFIGKS